MFSFILLMGMTGVAQAGTLSLGHFDRGVISGTEPLIFTDTCTDPGDDCGNDEIHPKLTGR